ncbi:MAG: RagB/SusD family nutrient uptake outer membrane protein [Prevotellaceae bacterium]|nr:RagB/SusD family nutrient uptake outer membrane protein [Prevotellaceae bacterium]
MKTKNTILFLGVACLCGMLAACSDFLDASKPNGILSQDEVSTVDNIDNMVIAAYAYMVTGEEMNSSFQLWQLGNIRSDDAYKGGANTEDGSHMYYAEIANGLTTDLWMFDDIWYRLYCGVARANDALRILNKYTEEEFPQKTERTAEMKFIRAHFMFKLKELFKYIPVVDENVPDDADAYRQISNRAYSNDSLWQIIADDFQYAYDCLPETQTEKGRPTKAAAAAYLAKTYLFKAYRQDNVDTHEITSIDAADLQKVITYTDPAIYTSAGYGLEDDFAYNFLPGSYENGKESIWAVQYSQNDGTKYGNLDFAFELTAPQGIGCCDFNKPSQNLVDAFKTDSNGLPLFDTYDADTYNSASDNVDTRLFHTVAIPGFQYKYNPDVEYTQAWARAPSVYGYFASLKENVDKDCDCLVQNGVYFANSKNWIVLRYADVMLMRAEAEVELYALGQAGGNLEDARSIVNTIRQRAAESITFIFDYDAKFCIGTYDTAWTSADEARNAVRWERRLELAMECGRFFDLVRWGVAEETMNAYYGSEKNRRSYLNSAYFTKNKNEYCPIPYKQINYSNNVYIQNCGWE